MLCISALLGSFILIAFVFSCFLVASSFSPSFSLSFLSTHFFLLPFLPSLLTFLHFSVLHLFQFDSPSSQDCTFYSYFHLHLTRVLFYSSLTFLPSFCFLIFHFLRLFSSRLVYLSSFWLPLPLFHLSIVLCSYHAFLPPSFLSLIFPFFKFSSSLLLLFFLVFFVPTAFYSSSLSLICSYHAFVPSSFLSSIFLF